MEAVAVDVNDKVMHAGAYFVLMVWFAGFYTRTVYPLIAAVLLVLGVGLDLLQGLTETRTFDWYDIAMNCAGVIVGLALPCRCSGVGVSESSNVC